MKPLEFVIRPKWDTTATKEGKKLTDEQRKQNTELDKQKKKWHEAQERAHTYLKTTEDGFVKLGRTISHTFEKAGKETRAAFANGPLTGIAHMQKGLEGLIGKVFTLKHALVGTAVGGAAFYGIHKLFEEGARNNFTKARLKREFGADAEFMEARARKAGSFAGIEDDVATKAAITIGESLSGVQAGTRRGGKKLNASEATALRKNLFEKGASLFERAATVTGAKGEEAEQLAYVMANAATGPEGMRGLVSSLHLNKALSAQVLKANAKGKLYEFLGADEAKKFGVEKGKKAGQGTIIDLMMTKSGITSEAAEAKRATLGFQIQDIGASLTNVLGEIGGKALDRVNGGFAKGVTLADKFKNLIESPKGKEMIEKISDGVGKVVEGFLKLATKIPEAFGFLERNKTLLLTIAGAYGGMRVVSGIGATVSGFKGVVGGVGGLVGDSAKVAGSITGLGTSALKAAGALTTAAAAGFALGTYLDEKFGLSDKLAATVGDVTGQRAEMQNQELRGVASHRGKLAGIAQAQKNKVAALEAQGLSHGQALAAAQHGSGFDVNQGGQTVHISLNLDGKVVTEVVNKHNTRRVKNATANGAAQ